MKRLPNILSMVFLACLFAYYPSNATGIGPTVDIPTIVINDRPGSSETIVLALTVELSDEYTKQVFNDRLDLITSSIKRTVMDADDSLYQVSGKKKLKEQMLDAINTMIGPGSAVAIYFTEFKVRKVEPSEIRKAEKLAI